MPKIAKSRDIDLSNGEWKNMGEKNRMGDMHKSISYRLRKKWFGKRQWTFRKSKYIWGTITTHKMMKMVKKKIHISNQFYRFVVLPKQVLR